MDELTVPLEEYNKLTDEYNDLIDEYNIQCDRVLELLREHE